MKKTAISFVLVLAMVLAMVLVPAPAAEAAGTKHDHTAATNHCVCGATSTDGTNWTGGAAGIKHTCTAISATWIDLNKHLKDGGSTVLGTKNEQKYYYLSANLSLSKYLQVTTGGNVTICLNGFDITTTATGDNGRIFYGNTGSATNPCTLNICDCQGGGQIIGSSSSHGSTLIVLNGKVFNTNLYSGTLTATSDSITGAGAVVRLESSICKLYNAVIKNGKTSGMGGNVALIQSSARLFMYGGRIENGSAATGGNIYLMNSSTFEMEGGVIIGGSIEQNTAHTPTITLKGGFVELDKDLTLNEKVTINATNDLIIDLNGKKLAGTVTGKISLADSSIAAGESTTITTDDVDIDGFGLANIDEQVVSCPTGRYITLEKNGELSIHRIYIGFDKIRLYKDDNGNIGMNYVTNFVLDDEVKALLVDDVDGYAAGCCFGVGDPELRMGETVGLAKAAYKADIATNIAAILDGEGDATAIATKIYANTFVNLNIGGQTVTVTSNTYGYSLQDVVDALNGIADLATQNAAAAELLADIKSRFN